MDKYMYTRSEWVRRKDVKMEIFENHIKSFARRRWWWRVAAAAAASKLMEAMMKRNLQREYSIFPFPFLNSTFNVLCFMFQATEIKYFATILSRLLVSFSLSHSLPFLFSSFLSAPQSSSSSSTCSFAYSTTQPSIHPIYQTITLLNNTWF